MPLLPFGDWRPDIADYQGQSTLTISGVLPRGDGYGPMRASAAYSSALPSACRGAFVAYKTDGSVKIFAATATDLYEMDNTTLAWTNRSKGTSYSAIPNNEQWQFAQFNNFVIAVSSITVPQFYDLSAAPVDFADLAGSPPTARYVSTVGRFLVLSGLVSNPYRIQWSGLNAITTWTSGINSSDFQDLPDGGIVRGVAGGESGTIFQDNAIRRMTFAVGASYVFLIERISQDKGLYAPYSIVRAGERIFFLSNQGFHQILPGASYPQEIGKEKFDRYFLNTILDRGQLQLVIGASDPKASRVFWSFRGAGMSANNYTALLCYDYVLDRATVIAMNGEYLVQMAQPGVTLEGLDALMPAGGSTGGIDTPGAASFDSYPPSSAPEIAQFDTSHKLAFFGGPPIEAIMDTAEEGTDGQRLRVQGLRPITDAGTVFASCSRRETVQSAATQSVESSLTRVGLCPLNVSTRYSRGRIRIPAGTAWTYAAGVEPQYAIEGLA